jgi:hypothetical protein
MISERADCVRHLRPRSLDRKLEEFHKVFKPRPAIRSPPRYALDNWHKYVKKKGKINVVR